MFNRTFMVKNEQFIQLSVRKNCKTSTMRDILSRIWIHQLSVICGNEACKALANRKFVLSGFSPWWRKNPSSLTVSCETFFHLCRTEFPRILHSSLHKSCFLLLGNISSHNAARRKGRFNAICRKKYNCLVKCESKWCWTTSLRLDNRQQQMLAFFSLKSSDVNVLSSYKRSQIQSNVLTALCLSTQRWIGGDRANSFWPRRKRIRLFRQSLPSS